MESTHKSGLENKVSAHTETLTPHTCEKWHFGTKVRNSGIPLFREISPTALKPVA